MEVREERRRLTRAVMMPARTALALTGAAVVVAVTSMAARDGP